VIKAVTVWQAAARPLQWDKDFSSGWQVRCSCRSSRPSWWQGPSPPCHHRQGTMALLIYPTAVHTRNVCQSSRMTLFRMGGKSQQLWRRCLSCDNEPCCIHSIGSPCWLQALGAKRRLLASTARSTWMSATVSLAPPYGNLPYGKLLDTLVAKDGLASGPTINIVCQFSSQHATTA
jgi:hypothetical protein